MVIVLVISCREKTSLGIKHGFSNSKLSTKTMQDIFRTLNGFIPFSFDFLIFSLFCFSVALTKIMIRVIFLSHFCIMEIFVKSANLQIKRRKICKKCYMYFLHTTLITPKVFIVSTKNLKQTEYWLKCACFNSELFYSIKTFD